MVVLDNILKVEKEIYFTKKFTFCTLVTRFDEYLEMIESAKKIGFNGDDVEFLYFDNNESNQFDGYSGVNRAIHEAKGEFLIFCHQDVLFKYDNRYQLEERLSELSKIDRNWALAGNAGINSNGETILRISDPNGNFQSKGDVPSMVNSLDENFIIINQRLNNACSYGLGGYHLYGIDLCHHASLIGLNSYVIDFNLYHKSAGKKDKSFFEARANSISFYKNQKNKAVFWTVCTLFFSTKNSFLNSVLNSGFFKKIYLKIKR